jgi:hypothetical protein
VNAARCKIKAPCAVVLLAALVACGAGTSWSAIFDSLHRRYGVAALESFIDRMTANALHCDRIALPADWETVLLHASNAGAYALTHAVVAGQWSIENGCRQRSELAGLQGAQLAFLERLADQRETLVATHAVGADICIEALAMLYYLDAGSRVRPEWIGALLASQRPDGGWKKGDREDRSDPHPTALAIWVLTARLQPDEPPVPWVARPARPS